MSISPMTALAGAAAAAAVGLAYLDARLNLRPDINHLMSRRMTLLEVTTRVSKGRASFYYFFEEAVKKYGNIEAIWFNGAGMSYNQAYDRVHQFAQWFLSQGVAPDDFVIFYLANSPDFMCAWLALLAIGAAPALVNTNLGSKALIHCVEIAEAKLILADGNQEMLGRLEEVRTDLEATGHRIVNLKDVREHILGMPPFRPGDEFRKAVQPTSPIALAYTSGTTGLPKAIDFPMALTLAATAAKKGGYNVLKGGGERQYNCMPYYHLTGGLSALQGLAVGDTLCIAVKLHASTFWDDIRASRATYFIYVGEVIRYLMAQPPSPLDRTHNVHYIFGNGLRADIWIPFRERFGIATIHEFYNSTEFMFGLSNPCRGDFTAKSLGQHGALLRWWFRNWYVAAAVDAETGELLRDPKTGFARRASLDEGGEILVELDPGSKVPGRDFRGYHKNEAATGKKLARDVFRRGDCYYRTGDALRRDAEGRWFFCDRLGDTFRWKGENVSTTEVADALGEYPGVFEANVYGVQLPGYEGRAGAVALLIEEPKRAGFDFAGFLRHCRSKLPKYAVPLFIRLTSASYSTGNHKQNKVPLKTEGVDPTKVSNGDTIYWIESNGRGDTFTPFTNDDWKMLQEGKAKL